MWELPKWRHAKYDDNDLNNESCNVTKHMYFNDHNTGMVMTKPWLDSSQVPADSRGWEFLFFFSLRIDKR
jgi:hypothetical protein